MRHTCLAFSFLLACGSGSEDSPVMPDATTTAPDAAVPAGVRRTTTVDGVLREYLVHVPPNLTAPAPVVVMIHGTSGDGQKFYNISGWVEKADEVGAIAVFPSALTYCLWDDENRDGDFDDAGEKKVTTKWAAGKLGTPEQPLCTESEIAMLPADKQALVSRTLHDDVALFDAIVADLADEGIDAKRIYVTGFSNGAQMSGRLLIERTNTFAAFAMNAGSPVVAGAALRPAPVVYAVGSKDDGVTARTGVAELPLDESLFDLPEIDALADDLCSRISLDCNARVSGISANQIGRHRYTTSTSGASNELVIAVIDEATHQYPNGQNHPVVMASLLWQFFAQYTL